MKTKNKFSNITDKEIGDALDLADQEIKQWSKVQFELLEERMRRMKREK